MPQISLDEALGALLLASGITVNEQFKSKDINNIDEYLGGMGLKLQRISLHHKVIPDEDEQIGCIAVLPDGKYLPVLGGGEDAILLNADGTSFRIANTEDIEKITEILVLSEQDGNTGRVLPYLRRHKSKLLEIFCCGILVNLFGLTLPLFSSFVYDKVLGNGITSTMWALVIGLLLIVAIEFSLRIIRIIVAERISRLSDAEIDHTVFRGLVETKANALPGIGTVLERYKQITSYRDFLSSSYMLALADLPFLLLFMLAIIIVSGPLVLVGIACGILVVIANMIFVFPAFDYEKKSRRASEKRLALLTDILSARDAILGAASQNMLARKWRAASLTATHSSSMARLWFGLGQSATNSLSFFSYVGVLVGGAYMVEDGSLTSGGLLATSMLTARMFGNFSSVSTLFVRYHEFKNAVSELNKILPAAINNRGASNNGELHGSVRIDHITCNIGHGGYPVLKDISLQIRHGEIVGIAGALGSGKTTLLRLICGLIQPDGGQVLINDIPIDRLTPEDISRTIGYKPQDICLMDGSIEENIRAGRNQPTAEMRKYLLETTGLMRDFQENGLNWATEIGQRGTHLSGGQKQLVALARAVYSQPPLILLDEPSNGLDAPLEEHIAKQLQKMKGKSTIIISTHSRQLLSICDRIIVIGKSKILADGPRDKVLLP
jgi:ABC-type bacteriocin/lantibiotic exporter with double-glycine peptidase domain